MAVVTDSAALREAGVLSDGGRFCVNLVMYVPLVVLLSREVVKLQAISARGDPGTGENHGCGQARDNEDRGYFQRRLDLDRISCSMASLRFRVVVSGTDRRECKPRPTT